MPRRSAFVRRASFEGSRAEADTLAANIDVVFLTHSFGHAPNQRRLERELVLAYDSGAEPVVVLTKADLVDDPEPARRELVEVAFGVPVHRDQRARRRRHRGAALVRRRRPDAGLPRGQRCRQVDARQRPARLARAGHDRGAHRRRPRPAHDRRRRTAARCPTAGWLVDTPGIRALSLWLSGDGIERAFADVFDLMEHCRFRDCKHDQEPGCAVRAAIADGALDPDRFASLERLVAEEVALEAEQRARTKTGDRRRGGRPPPEAAESADSEDASTDSSESPSR